MKFFKLYEDFGAVNCAICGTKMFSDTHFSYCVAHTRNIRDYPKNNFDFHQFSLHYNPNSKLEMVRISYPISSDKREIIRLMPLVPKTIVHIYDDPKHLEIYRGIILKLLEPDFPKLHELKKQVEKYRILHAFS